MLKHFLYFSCLCFVLLQIQQNSKVFSDIRSTNGNIIFNLEGYSSNIQLNTTGLGINTQPSANLHVKGNTIISGRLGIGTASPNSSLDINGTLAQGMDSISSNTTIGSNSVVLINTFSNNITVSLPAADNIEGRIYLIKKTSPLNRVTVTASNNIESYTDSIILEQTSSTRPYIKIISAGTQWLILNKSDNILLPCVGDNLIGWWRLDETGSTIANDSSGRNLDGSLENGFTFSGNGTTGKIGKALSFDGVSDYISLGTDSSLAMEDRDFTFAAWIKPSETVSGWAGILGADYEGASLGLKNGNLQLTKVGIADATTSGVSPVLNTWTHVAAVFDSHSTTNNLKYFVNGQLVSTVSFNNDFFPVTYPTSTSMTYNIGAWRRTLGGFKGALDDVRIYNRSLSSAEVLRLYNYGTYFGSQ